MPGRLSGPALAALLALALGGCDDAVTGEGSDDYRLRDVQPALGDAQRDDVAVVPIDQAVAPADGGLDRAVERRDGGLDSGGLDRGPPGDMRPAPLDMAPPLDVGPPADMAPPLDMAPPIDMQPDMGPVLPPGREPCQQGPGWSLLRLRWDDFSDSARVDHWDVPCDYSIRINDACGAFDRCRGGVGCDVGRTNTGAVELDGSDDLLIWFSTPPENVQAAVFYLLGRSLCAASSTDFDLDSPTDGWAVSGGPVGQQFEYQWHFAALPGFAGDDLALRLTAGAGCGRLGVQALEICVP